MPVTFVWGNVSSRRVCKLPARDHWISLPSRMKRTGVGLAVFFFPAASSEKVVMHIWCRARNWEKIKDLEQYMLKVSFYNQGPHYKDLYLHVYTYMYLSTMARFADLASEIGFFLHTCNSCHLVSSEPYIHSPLVLERRIFIHKKFNIPLQMTTANFPTGYTVNIGNHDDNVMGRNVKPECPFLV